MYKEKQEEKKRIIEGDKECEIIQLTFIMQNKFAWQSSIKAWVLNIMHAYIPEEKKNNGL